MICYRGEEIRKMTTAVISRKYRKRFLLSELDDYFFSDDERVCCLYGLRRTGKTVAMLQYLDSLNDYDNCIYIRCQPKDSIDDLLYIIASNDDINNFFIDEATKMEDFIDMSSELADGGSFCGKRILLTGTDSLGFMFASMNELYGRIKLIHTTYISFREYHYLLGKDVDNYIMYGGTLTPDKTFISEESCSDYTHSAIANNIQHSLKYCQNGELFGELYRYYKNGSLNTVIQKNITSFNRRFVRSVLFEKFNSHEIGILSKYMGSRVRHENKKIIANSDLMENILKELDIKEDIEILSKEAFEQLKRYLKRLDLLYINPKNPKDILFLQTGLRYRQCTTIISVLEGQDWFGKLGGTKALINQIDSDVKGNMLEEIIHYDCYADEDFSKEYETYKYRNPDGVEIDLIIIDKSNNCHLFEVKYDSRPDSKHKKNIKGREDFIAEIEEKFNALIVSKSVIYTGESFHSPDNIDYIKADDFLCNKKLIVEQLLLRYQENPALYSYVPSDYTSIHSMDKERKTDINIHKNLTERVK